MNVAATSPRFGKWLAAGLLLAMAVAGYWLVAGATALDPAVADEREDRSESVPVGASTPLDGPEAGSAPANGVTADAGRAESSSTPPPGAWVLAVRAVDSLGDPVAAAAVELSRSLADEQPYQEGHVDGDGVGRLFVRDDSVFVRVRHPDFGESVRVLVQRATAPAEPMPLMLLRAVLVRGLVIGSEGEPIVGASVKVTEHWKGGALLRATLTADSFVTDREGRFEFDCVVGTQIELVADELVLSSRAAESLLVTQPCEVVLASHGAFRIDGSFVDASGRSIHGTAGASGFQEWSGKLRTPGSTFALTLARPGLHVLRATVAGHMARSIEVMLSVQQRHRTVGFVAHPTMATRGKVVDDLGRPVHRAFLVAKPDDPAWGEVLLQPEDGSFEFPLVPATGWTLTAHGTAGNGIRCRAGDSELRLVVTNREQPRQSTVGVDVFAVDGASPSHVVFSHISGQGMERTIETVSVRGAPPRVTLELPFPRERWLLLAADPFSKHAGHVWVETDDRPLQLVLEPMVPVEVTVRRAGRPVRGVTVRIEPCGGSEKVRVDANGVARFGGLPHGPASVRVLRGNEELATKEVLLRTRDFAFVTIDLP